MTNERVAWWMYNIETLVVLTGGNEYGHAACHRCTSFLERHSLQDEDEGESRICELILVGIRGIEVEK